MGVYVEIAVQEGDERQDGHHPFHLRNVLVMDRRPMTGILDGKGVEDTVSYDLLLIGTVHELHEMRRELDTLLGPRI